MKKSISLAVTFVMIILLFASCGKEAGAEPPTTTAPATAAAPKATLPKTTYEEIKPGEDDNPQIVQGENSGVVLTVKTNKTVYKPDDEITVTVRACNHSDKTVYHWEPTTFSDPMGGSLILTTPSGETKNLDYRVHGDMFCENYYLPGETSERIDIFRRWSIIGGKMNKYLIKEIEDKKLPETGKYTITSTVTFGYNTINTENGLMENIDDIVTNDHKIEVECEFYITEDGLMP